jgi:aspartate/methionine/tyrosine aminotransferase
VKTAKKNFAHTHKHIPIPEPTEISEEICSFLWENGFVLMASDTYFGHPCVRFGMLCEKLEDFWA